MCVNCRHLIHIFDRIRELGSAHSLEDMNIALNLAYQAIEHGGPTDPRFAAAVRYVMHLKEVDTLLKKEGDTCAIYVPY